MANTNDIELLTGGQSADGIRLYARGSWTADHAAKLDSLIDTLLLKPRQQEKVAIDASGIERLDTYGAALLERLRQEAPRQAEVVKVAGLPAKFQELQSTVHRATPTVVRESQRRCPPLDTLASIGEATADAGRDLLLLLNMLGAVSLALLGMLRRPGAFRFTSTIHQLDRVCWEAVPIILLITFLIGSIIAQQGFFHFRKFGADDYVVDMVGILVLREIGVLIVSIMVAGRSGSSYTAELGSMRMREEVDALRTMGLDPVQVLILPRMLALVIALPILTFLGSMAALYGGGMVAWLYGGMSPEIFIARLRDAISITHFKVGMVKAPFMALVIGAVACTEGFQVKGSAESLGLKTTASVVKAIFLVIVLDGLFAVFFASIGM